MFSCFYDSNAMNNIFYCYEEGFFFFFDIRGCPSQLMLTSTNSTGPWSEQPGKSPVPPKRLEPRKVNISIPCNITNE